MAIRFTTSGNEAARIVQEYERADLFIVDLRNELSPAAIVDVIRGVNAAHLASIAVIGSESEVAHDAIDDCLLDQEESLPEEPSEESVTMTWWLNRDLTVDSIAHQIRWMSPTGHAIVWVPDPELLALIDGALPD